jgi:phosphate transport system substrate-binding protein
VWCVAKKQVALAALTFVLAGCQPAVETPPPIPDIPIVHVSPAAVPFAMAWARQYQTEVGVLPFDLIPIGSQAGAQAVADGRASLMIDFPPPQDGWFVTPLGWEAVALVVDPHVPVRALSIEDLRAAFAGRITSWSELGGSSQSIQIIIPPAGDRLRQLFLDRIVFDGRVTTNALLAPTPSRALDLVAENPGALAVVPVHSLPDERVAAVRIEGALPSPSTAANGRYPLRTSILASAPNEPEGAVRDWLVWMQAHGLPAAAPTATSAPAPTSEPD